MFLHLYSVISEINSPVGVTCIPEQLHTPWCKVHSQQSPRVPTVKHSSALSISLVHLRSSIIFHNRHMCLNIHLHALCDMKHDSDAHYQSNERSCKCILPCLPKIKKIYMVYIEVLALIYFYNVALQKHKN